MDVAILSDIFKTKKNERTGTGNYSFFKSSLLFDKGFRIDHIFVKTDNFLEGATPLSGLQVSAPDTVEES